MFYPSDDEDNVSNYPEQESIKSPTTLEFDATPQVFFDSLVSKYQTQLNKLDITNDLIEYCEKNTNENVFELKKLMDIRFSSKITCKYSYLGQTPQDYGCDLREIIYNRDGSLFNSERTAELLRLFAEKQLPEKVYHIMTDVDDTLFAHTSAGVAGADASWTEKIPYPGIIMFYELFYNKLQEMFRYSTVLSATPGVLKSGRINNDTMKTILKEYSFIQGNIESKTGMLTQGLASGVQGLTQHFGRKAGVSLPDYTGIHKGFGDTKFQRYKQYKSIFPEYKIIFLGDNGQGDLIAGKQMLDEPGTDTIVCIHKVIEGKLGRKESSDVKPGLYFFEDYYDLANTFTPFLI
jgi:hypothetical protein